MIFFTATLLVREAVGASTEVTQLVLSKPEILVTRANAAMVARTTANSFYLSGVALAGGGDGAKLSLAMHEGKTATAGVGPVHAPATGTGAGMAVFMYYGKTEERLNAAYLIARAAMKTWANLLSGASGDCCYIDHQIAGRKQGGRFVGMIILNRKAGSQP